MAMTKAVSSAKFEIAYLTGSTAADPIACSSAGSVAISTSDEIFFCVELAATTANHTDRTSTTTIPAAGYIACSADTSGDKLLLGWLDKDATTGYSSANFRVSFIAADASASVAEVLADITTDDVIVACYTCDSTSGILVDITSTTSCATNGYLTITSGTEHGIILFWYDVSGASKTLSSFCPQFAILAGTTAATNITLTGAAIGDQMYGVGEFSASHNLVVADRTSTSSVTTAANYQCSASTASNALWVFWNDASA